MPLTTTTARNSVKARLDIDTGVTTFDSAIDEFVLSGVERLYPIAQRELPVQTTVVTADSFGEATIDLSSLSPAVSSARRIEVSTGAGFYEHSDYYHQGTTLYLRDLVAGSVSVRVWGLTTYTLTDVPDYLKSAIVWFAMSEFYDFLAGNKRKYNAYMQGGGRAVDDMRDESDFYETKANVFLNDRSTIYGVS